MEKLDLLNDLQKIVREITYRTGHELKDIAENIDYSRPHLSTAINQGDNIGIKDRLLKFYKNDLKDYYENIESSLELHEDPVPYKEVDADQQLVQDVLLAKAMLRVVLRNQAEMLAKQRKVDVKIVLAELTKAVRAEISNEFDEL